MFSADLPIVQYLDLNGNPLNGGKVYIGQPNQNPETSPMTVYWDFAGTQPAAQPIRTTNGYSVRSGIISPIFVSGDFSITIRDAYDKLIYTAPKASEAGSIQAMFSTLTSASLIGYLQAGTGATQRTSQDKMRDRLDMRDFGVVAGDGNDHTSALQAAFNEASALNIPCYGPSGNIIISSTLTPMCSIIGEGAPYNGTGMTFQWEGSTAKVFEFASYTSGWLFERFRIDMQSVTTDTTAMYFDAGLNGACFRDVELRGKHTGASWGGTYYNHDGIYIAGGSGGTKYDMSQNRFERVFWTRLRNGLTVTDPSTQGPGNGNTFDGCFSWCNGWTVSMPGANNILLNCEFNAEANCHAIVQTGQFAVGWCYIGCDWGTAASGDGNQPIYADTSGGADICTLLGGTIETSNGGGVPQPIKDAGTTGGKVYRYLKFGQNNSDSDVLAVDQLQIGQSSVTSQFFYKEVTWTPEWSGLTVVGSASYSGQGTLIGNRFDWTVEITAGAGNSTASTAGTTRITNMPFTQTGLPATCTASDAASLASYGVGQGATGGKSMFTPTWAATSDGIVISGFYFTDGT